MYSEDFMRYLIVYKNEDLEPLSSKSAYKSSEKRPLMVDLTGVKYVVVPIENRAK